MNDLINKSVLKPKESKFENFHIRYEVEESDDLKMAIHANAWEVQSWGEDGSPVFHAKGPHQGGGVEKDPLRSDPVFELYTKRDGCSHLRMAYLHFDDLEKFDSFSRCVKFIYDDLCKSEGVNDI